MSTIDSTSGSTSTQPTPTTLEGGQVSKLGKDDFLKLLVAQLRNQDPLQPVADNEFMGQMAQFSTLEQITNVAGSMDALRQSAQWSDGLSLLGRTVTYENEDGVAQTGVASEVHQGEDGLEIVLDSGTISLADVRSVK